MLQAYKELISSKLRTGIITLTIALIALMVTFLSALTQGLSYEAVSALRYTTEDDALVVSDSTSTLSASHIDEVQQQALEDLGARPFYIARDKQDGESITIINDSAQPVNSTSYDPQDVYLDHQHVQWEAMDVIEQKHGSLVAMILPDEHVDQVTTIDGVQALTGSDKWKSSAAYAGEQLSLNLMIGMLYLVSTLVVGAFFIVWTLQRLHGIAVFSALGASRRVLILQSLIQAMIVTIVGIIIGGGLTIGLVAMIGDSLPAVISAQTIGIPSLLLFVAAVIGASGSLIPILRIDPKEALETA